MPLLDEKAPNRTAGDSGRSGRGPIALLALPWVLAPAVAHLIPSWYAGGFAALLVATVAGLIAFVVLVVRLFRRARPKHPAFCVAIMAAAPIVLGGLDYRIYVRDSFLPFYRRYGELWYLREEDLPGPSTVCAELGHPIGR